MKPHIIAAAVITLACQSIVAAASLSSEDIQAAIDEAIKPPRHYIGDFTSFRFISDPRSESSSGRTVRLSLAIPPPAMAQRSVAHPSYLESFGYQ